MITLKSLISFSHTGKRPHQEDAVLGDKDKGILIVADGFGGAVAGAGAAQAACESVRSFLFRQARDLEATLPFVLRQYFSLPGNVLFNAFLFANQKILDQNKSKSAQEKGGASLLAGFLDGSLLALAHVGSNSAYLMRGDGWVRLVTPRSYAQLCNPFPKTQAAAHLLAGKQVPLAALGMTHDLEPEIYEYRLEPDDWVLFSTDGVSEDIVQNILTLKQTYLTIEEASLAIQKYLKTVNCDDNSSILIGIF